LNLREIRKNHVNTNLDFGSYMRSRSTEVRLIDLPSVITISPNDLGMAREVVSIIEDETFRNLLVGHQRYSNGDCDYNLFRYNDAFSKRIFSEAEIESGHSMGYNIKLLMNRRAVDPSSHLNNIEVHPDKLLFKKEFIDHLDLGWLDTSNHLISLCNSCGESIVMYAVAPMLYATLGPILMIHFRHFLYNEGALISTLKYVFNELTVRMHKLYKSLNTFLYNERLWRPFSQLSLIVGHSKPARSYTKPTSWSSYVFFALKTSYFNFVHLFNTIYFGSVNFIEDFFKK